jgi:hypothetical protein
MSTPRAKRLLPSSLTQSSLEWLVGFIAFSILALTIWSDYQQFKEAEERRKAVRKAFEEWQPLLQQQNALPQPQPVQNP